MCIIVIVKKIISVSEKENTLKAFVIYKEEQFTLYSSFLTWLKENNTIIIYGTINESKKYIKAQTCIPYLEKNLNSFKSFLMAAKITGLSEKKILTLSSIFKEKLISIFFEDNFEILGEIPFFTKEKRDIIKNQWLEIKAYSDLHMALYESGLSASSVKRLYKTYKDKALIMLKINPYQIIGEIGYGFLTADKIAQEYGIQENAAIRIEAAILYIIKKNELSGQSYITHEALYTELHILFKKKEIQIELFSDSLKNLTEKKIIIVIQGTYIASQHIYIYESFIRKFLLNGSSRREYPLKLTENTFLNDEQKKAIEGALTHLYTVITGSAGTGKTTVITFLYKLFIGFGRKVLVLTPTGRAAQRIKELLQEAIVMTIHKALGIEYIHAIQNNSDYKDNNLLPFDHIIVDESSMIDSFLFYCLLKKLKKTTTITFVGDKDQLPPIGVGAVFETIIELKIIPIFFLHKIQRQKTESNIIKISKEIADGSIPKIPLDQSHQCSFQELAKERLSDEIKKLVDLHFDLEKNLLSFQIISFLYKGKAGINNANIVIQEIIRKKRNISQTERILYKFFLYDRVIVTKNNYDLGIFNGEIGYIAEGNNKQAKIIFSDKEVHVSETHENILDLAYAISVHKSQGSEFDLVIMLIYCEQYILLNKKSIYTCVTRAKKKIIIIGEKKALFLGIKNKKQVQNNSLIPIMEYISA